MRQPVVALLLATCAAQITINRVPIGNGQRRPQGNSLVLEVQGVGNLTVPPNEEPATAVERFAARATEAGFRMNNETMLNMMGWLCERRQCSRPLTGPVLLEVTGAGNLTVLMHEEPAAKVEEFAASAVANGIPFNVETMKSMLQSLCGSRSCFRDIAGPLTLNVTDIGEFTVLPWEEPADRVEYFTGLVVESGVGMTRQSAQQMLEWFCGKRVCRRGLTRPLTLSIGDVGNVTCRPFEEPAFVIERFASAATQAGLAINAETMLAALEWFCARRSCHRPITGPHFLTVTGVGNITVRPSQDPAAQVERFAAQASEMGYAMNTDSMLEMYGYFCERRSCHRRLTGPWTLQLDVANVTVRPFEEPARIVEVFGAKALQAGLDVDEAMLQQILDFFCERRSCHRPLNPALELNVPDLGTLKVVPHEDPADAVEQFALSAAQRGLEMTGVQMVEMLTLICEQRVCRRLSVRPVDSLNQTQAALIPPAAEAMPSAAEAAVDAAPVADTVVEMGTTE